jgi:hypothetical protein
MYAATTKDEGNAADGRFSTACLFLTMLVSLVYLVYLVSLVCLVSIVYLVC